MRRRKNIEQGTRSDEQGKENTEGVGENGRSVAKNMRVVGENMNVDGFCTTSSIENMTGRYEIMNDVIKSMTY